MALVPNKWHSIRHRVKWNTENHLGPIAPSYMSVLLKYGYRGMDDFDMSWAVAVTEHEVVATACKEMAVTDA